MRLTLISAPKPFEDARIAVIQGNALASWAKLKGVEVFLMGEGSGVADAARTHGAVHLPNVRTNERGTPLISSMLELARRYGGGDILGIVNADMILMGDLVNATSLVSAALPEYLLLARRWDLEFVRAVYAAFNGRQDFSWLEARELLRAHPGLLEINGNVRHKTMGEVDARADGGTATS